VLELRGADRHALLASGCAIDLDPVGGWVPGVCAQTLFARSQVLLQELDGATRIFVRPSFAGYVVDRLLAAR
jgi:heterotetrameric sarcosine oxidase gamma subunit